MENGSRSYGRDSSGSYSCGHLLHVTGFYSEHLKSIPYPLCITDRSKHPLVVAVGRNSRLPAIGIPLVYSTANLTDRNMKFSIYQGESTDDTTTSSYVAIFNYAVDGPSQARKTDATADEVEITLKVDAHGKISALLHDFRWGNRSTRN